jgi:hypothetical protein
MVLVLGIGASLGTEDGFGTDAALGIGAGLGTKRGFKFVRIAGLWIKEGDNIVGGPCGMIFAASNIAARRRERDLALI